MIARIFVFIALLAMLSGCERKSANSEGPSETPLRLQLNWFHDPTFAGEYRAAHVLGSRLVLLEGGANISSLQRLKSGLADFAVAGIDLTLQAIEADLASAGATPLRIVFADFQRNPVGWVVHPSVGERFGLRAGSGLSGQQRNEWLFARFRDGAIRPGDKRGTETSAVWARWRQVRGLRGVTVTPVGFDPTIVLDAPRLAYPVYLNEEPFKLSERIGTPILTFDPADDNVVLYGNVIVTTAELLERSRGDLDAFRNTLDAAWRWVRSYPDSAAALVRPFYRDVSDAVLASQVRRTAEFVFYGVDTPGQIDVRPGGRLEQTIDALRSAGSLGPKITLEAVAPLIATAPGGSR